MSLSKLANDLDRLAHKLSKGTNIPFRKLSGSEQVKTQDGRIVILNSNGTWKYEEQSENKPSSSNVVYLMAPSNDGTFNRKYETNKFVDTESVYKFESVSANKNEAQFSMDERAFSRALNMPDTYIDPVCESVNAFSHDYTSIKTLKKGVATINDSKWVVKQKAQIQYE